MAIYFENYEIEKQSEQLAWQRSKMDLHDKVSQFNFNWIFRLKRIKSFATSKFVEKKLYFERVELYQWKWYQSNFFFHLCKRLSAFRTQYWKFCIRLSFEFLLIERKAKNWKEGKKNIEMEYSYWILYVMKRLRCRWSDFKIEMKSSIIISMKKRTKNQPIYLKFGLKWKIWKIKDGRDNYKIWKMPSESIHAVQTANCKHHRLFVKCKQNFCFFFPHSN